MIRVSNMWIIAGSGATRPFKTGLGSICALHGPNLALKRWMLASGTMRGSETSTLWLVDCFGTGRAGIRCRNVG